MEPTLATDRLLLNLSRLQQHGTLQDATKFAFNLYDLVSYPPHRKRGMMLPQG